MANIEYGMAESVKEVAERLIPEINPDIASANILYLFKSKPFKQSGNIIPGVVKKVPDWVQYVTEFDFVIIVGLPTWNEYSSTQRTAAVDHLISMISAEEDEQTGEMKYAIKKPTVQEFPEVVARNGLWNDEITDMASKLAGARSNT